MRLPPFSLPPLTLALAFTLAIPPAFSQEKVDQLDTIDVSNTDNNAPSSRMIQVKNDIIQTEVITSKKIEKKQAANLAQAIEDEPGVKVSTECSMCGVKRIMLNGLKGEHTTLMINGVPNSSIVESFYGFDAIPMAGVTSIEISRGAGASLIASEAIGGVINVVTDKPRQNKLTVDVSRGNQEYHKYQLSGTQVSSDNKTALAISAQSDYIDQYDQDNNDVNESPSLRNQGLSAQVWHQLDNGDNLDVRIEDQNSEVFGGPMIGSDLASSESDARTQETGSSPGFIDDNVNNNPSATSSAKDFLENIESTKQSYTAKWRHDVNPDLQTRATVSYVDSAMDAIYEGTTYQADQDIFYIDLRGDYFVNDQHALTFGSDYKLDTMRSESSGGLHPADDSYDMTTQGFYLRDIWTPAHNLEISAALRLDQISVDFVDQDKTFDETMVAPRLHVQYDHNFNWTSRLSAGKGYRVPLQFFEADHGILDDGFGVDVDKLEQSNSARYALTYTGADTLFETSYSWTSVDNLTYIDMDNYSRPTLVNSDETGTVQHADIMMTHQLTGHWSIGASLEGFMYDKAYRDTFGVIPIEERLKLMADYEGHGWEANFTVTAVGERQYEDYAGAAYDSHYDGANGVDSKGDHSPAYFTADVRLAKEINKNWEVYGGINNLFDYTQTSEGDSPLFYDGASAGSEDWDVGHIWGPLRGRLVYAGVKASF